MSTLAIDAGATGVTVVVVSAEGDVVARAHREVPRLVPEPGGVEHAPEDLWQATLLAARDAVDRVDPTTLSAVAISGHRDTVVLWDRDTLGSPRRALGVDDRRSDEVCADLRGAGHEPRVRELTGLGLDPRRAGPRLRWLAEHEPRTWALVESGRYAVGPVDSYLLARLTRGLEHVTDVSHACRTALLDLGTADWSDELCSLLGVPRDALPELVPTWGELAVTDRRSFLDLELPVTALVADRMATHAGLACVGAGDASGTYDVGGSVLLTTGRTLVRPADPGPRPAGVAPTILWRSPTADPPTASRARRPRTRRGRTTTGHRSRRSRGSWPTCWPR